MEVRLLLGVPPAFAKASAGKADKTVGARRSARREDGPFADAIDLCPVAQRMRAPSSEGGGRAFESRRDNQFGRWCVVARNRSRKPGRPHGRGFDSFTFRQCLVRPCLPTFALIGGKARVSRET